MMAEGAGEQANLYRALADVAKQVGQAIALTETKVSYKDLMNANTETRKECAAVIADAMATAEAHTRAQLDAALANVVASIGDKVVSAMQAQRDAETKARQEARATEDENDRRIRRAMRTSWIGAGTGGVGVLAAIAQGMGWINFG